MDKGRRIRPQLDETILSPVRSQPGEAGAVYPFDNLRTGLAYNLGNFFRRLALLEAIKRWSLTSVQTRLTKIGGRLVRHARRLVFQLAGGMVTQGYVP